MVNKTVAFEKASCSFTGQSRLVVHLKFPSLKLTASSPPENGWLEDEVSLLKNDLFSESMSISVSGSVSPHIRRVCFLIHPRSVCWISSNAKTAPEKE